MKTHYRPQALQRSSSLADRRHSGVEVAPQFEQTDFCMALFAPVSQLGDAPNTLCSTRGEPIGEFGMDVGAELVLYWLKFNRVIR